MYHFPKMAAKSKLTQPPSDPPPWLGTEPTPAEQWYLECLRQWCHCMGRAPSIAELGAWIERSNMPTWTALASLESKGLTTRTAKRRFIPIEFRGVIR